MVIALVNIRVKMNNSVRVILGTKRTLSFLAGLICCLLSAQSFAHLPDLGDPADAVITPDEEYRLGQRLLVDVRNQLPMIDDAELNYYLSNLGSQLTNVSENTNFPFTFAIVDDSTLNAFAMPGGIIVLHRGIIETSESEGELASVLAHEIAHVTQRHMARRFESSKGLSLKTALGVLAAILIGSQNGEAGQAALYGTLASGQSERLAFSRENEREADRIGREILNNAKYDVNDMTRFFTRLKEASHNNPDEIVEFLRTHPLTDQRIADSMLARNEQENEIEERDEIDFKFARARLKALHERPDLRRNYLDRKDINAKPEEIYKASLRHYLAGKYPQATDLLNDLREPYTSLLSVQLLQARLLAANKNNTAAIKRLQEMDQLYPDNPAIIEELSRVWISNDEAPKAYTLLGKYPSLKDVDINLLKLKAEAARIIGKSGNSHEALAEYYYYSGDVVRALEQIKIALRQKNLSSIMRTRLEQNVSDLEPVVKRIRKKQRRQQVRAPLASGLQAAFK